jgi:signal transduction histidine kinase
MVDPLSLQNIDVEWSIAELLSYGPLAPRQLMDVVRVIQEAIHNAVVRAECNFLSVTAERLEGTYRIKIINLGGKTYSYEEKTGRGIANMKERAARLGGALSIYSKDTGASLLLTLPVIKV